MRNTSATDPQQTCNTSPTVAQQPPAEDISAQDVVHHYMLQADPHFRRRHESFALIRAHLEKIQATGDTSEPFPKIKTDEDDQIAEVQAAIDPRSPLDRLPPARQRLLYDLISDFGSRAVAAVIAAPEPAGWGLTVEHTSLHRFAKRYERRAHSRRQAETQQLTRELLADPQSTTEDFAAATERLFQMRLVDQVNDPATTPRELRDLLQAHTRLRALALAAQRLGKPKSKHPHEASKSPRCAAIAIRQR